MLSVVTMAQDFRDYGGKNYESEENFLTYERAIQDFNQALQLSPNFAMAYNNRGVAYMLADNIKKANADFSKATELGYSD